MKLKKILAMVLCLAMVLSTMSFSVFAKDAITVDSTDAITVDSTDAFRTALDKAQDGDVIEILAGKFNFADAASITIDKAITIKGAGKDETTLNFDSATSAFVIASNDVTFSDMTITQGTEDNSFHISISKGAWNAPAVQYSNVTIKNINFVGGKYSLCLIGENVVVDSCEFTEQDSHNIIIYSVKGESKITNNIFNPSTSTKTNRAAIYYEGGADNATDLSNFIGGGTLTIDGNEAYSKGLFFHFTNWNLLKDMNISITNNKIDAFTNKAISLYDNEGSSTAAGDEFASFVISENVFTNVPEGKPIIQEYTDTVNVDVSKNYLGGAEPDVEALIVGDKVTVASYYSDEACETLVTISAEGGSGTIVPTCAGYGTIKTYYEEGAGDANGTYVHLNIDTAYAESSLVLELYAGDTLLSTTKLNDPQYLKWNGRLTANIEISREADAWETEWVGSNPNAFIVPTTIKVYADGKFAFETTVNVTSEEWAATEGVKNYVAQIGEDKYFETLADAIAAATAGDTITLLADVTEDVTVSKNLTIDGANKKYTGNISVDNSKTPNVEVTVKNINFVNGTGYAITTNRINSITVEDCTVTNYGYGFLYANKSTPTVKVKNVTVDDCSYGIHWVYGTSATLENVTMTNVTNGLLIQNYAGKTVTLKNCNLTNINIWERDGSSGVQTFKFEGGNTVSTLSESQCAKYVLADANATLTAPEGHNVTSSTENYGVIYENGTYSIVRVAEVDGVKYASLQEAVNYGGEIKVLADVSENITIADGANIDLDLNGKTLNGYIAPCKPASLTVKNGSIKNAYSSNSAIEVNAGTLKVENVNIDSERHAVRIDGPVTATINGGTYKVLVNNKVTAHAVNVSGAANVTIKDGTFYGPKGTPNGSGMGGSAVQAQVGSTVTIEGGNFSGGVNNTLSGSGTLVVCGGIFDQDPSTYVAEGYETLSNADAAYPYYVAEKAAEKINVKFVEAKDENGNIVKGLYDIVLESADNKYNINEFVSAELTFKNTSTTAAGKDMEYIILPIEGKTAVDANYGNTSNDTKTFGIRIIDGEDYKNRLSGTSFAIAQVKFDGVGNINFGIDANSTIENKVVTTMQNTNLGRYYKVSDETLDVNAKISGGNINEVLKTVKVKIAFNHPIDGQYWKDNDEKDANKITVTLTDSFDKTTTETVDLKNATDTSVVTVVFENVPCGMTDVKLEAPGFRTYPYSTLIEEEDGTVVGEGENAEIVLNFWNDVKRNENNENTNVSLWAPIREGGANMSDNFLVGDIVMDHIVDKYDLAAVTSYYGMYELEDANKYLRYDLNRDGNIDIIDVHYVLHTLNH